MDMSQFVVPKSTQLNADDLVSGPRTIRITRVTGTGNGEQPVAVYFDGDDGRPFLPCKSMRRVMIAAWGVDASTYIGRSLTIYRDPEVTFGGMKLGGIRISHMSHLAQPLNLALTVTKSKRAPYKVAPLATPKEHGAIGPAPSRTPAVDPGPADGNSTKGSDPSAPETNGSGGGAPSFWDAGEVEKTQRFRIPLMAPESGETRYFADVPSWCQAFCELVDGLDPWGVWEANQETHATLAKSIKNETMQGHLKAAADYAFAASKPPILGGAG